MAKVTLFFVRIWPTYDFIRLLVKNCRIESNW